MCPYYFSDYIDGVNCECGKLRFKSTKHARQFFEQYCANNPGWEQCTLAKHLTKRILEEDNDKKKT